MKTPEERIIELEGAYESQNREIARLRGEIGNLKTQIILEQAKSESFWDTIESVACGETLSCLLCGKPRPCLCQDAATPNQLNIPLE